MTRSLRFRLLLGTSLATSATLALLGFAIFFSMRRSLTAAFDVALLAKARALTGTVEQHGQHLHVEFDPRQMPEYAARNRPEYFEIRLGNGVPIAASPSLGGGRLFAPRPGVATGLLPDGRPGRFLTLPFVPRLESHDEPDEDEDRPRPEPRPAELTVARETAPLDFTLDRLRWLLVTLCGGATVVSGTVLVWVVGGAVRPVSRLAREIGDLRETDLSRRLAAGGVPTELTPVVDRLNGLLARLEAAFARERAFTADVAHELRTPLSGLRTTLEVCRSRPRDNAAYAAVVDKCFTMTDHLQGLVQGLLLLARADGGQLPIRPRPVDLARLLDDSWAAVEGRAAGRRLRLQRDVPDDCAAEADPDLLRVVVDNLFENAVTYADEGGVVRVAASGVGRGVAVTLSNTGSHVAADDAGRVFERFWRHDESRTDTGVHCGLGLSLCERLVKLLGGTISVQTETGGLFVVRLVLPKPVSGEIEETKPLAPAGSRD